MQKIHIRHIANYCDDTVQIDGWVTHVRSSGKLIFIEMRDGTGVIQCVVFKGDVDEHIFNSAKTLTLETSLSIEGVVRRDDRSRIGYEIGVTDLNIYHLNDDTYPITPKDHGVAYLMENRHLWLRSSRQVALLKIRSTIIHAGINYLHNNEFVRFDPPILTPTSCEGTTTLFETDYFDRKAYLTQSGQLYLEAGALSLGRVYSVGPTFRAEKSKTRRHLTEFWMIEPEAAFFDLDADMELAEGFVSAIVSAVINENAEDLEILGRDISTLEKVTAPFPKITYDDALKILAGKGHHVEWGEDFGAEDETILSQEFDRPVIVHRYPVECKAFYMKYDPDRPDVALCCDMLAPEGYGEIIGGGQREDDYETLVKKITDEKLDRQPLEWYLDLRKYGSVPHAGFGLGIERTVTWICGLHHVRETIPFPRMLERIWP